MTAPDEKAFKQFVIDARDVNPKTLPILYAKALVIYLARTNGELAGVGAIKRPFDNHREAVFAAANAECPPTSLPAGAADSMGRYYNAQIKGRYDCRQGHVPDY